MFLIFAEEKVKKLDPFSLKVQEQESATKTLRNVINTKNIS